MASTTSETLNWTGCAMVRREPGKLGGAPNVNGKRITPESFVEHWNSGDAVNDILDWLRLFQEVDKKLDTTEGSPSHE